MGMYINQNSKGEILPAKGKFEALKSDGATVSDSKFKENLVLVADNGNFDCAAYMFSQKELDYWINDNSGRKKKAKELAH